MREIVREAKWIEDKPARARTGLATILSRQRNAVTFAVMAVANLLVTPYLGMFGGMGFTFFLTPAFLVLAIYAWSQELPAERERHYDALREEFMGVRGTLVQMIVRQGDAPTGEDEGVLWFEEGRLYFAGRRTSFGLVPGQSTGECHRRTRVKGIHNGVEIPLRVRTVAGTMTLSFDPILPGGGDAAEGRRLQTELARWTKGRAEGEGQYPARALAPNVVSEGRILLGALVATVPIPLAVALWLGSFVGRGWPLTIFVVGLYVFAGMVPGSNLRWRALRDRRRLGRGR